ncbi:MAG: hypothetical protein ACREN4_04805 [Candidatus Dormibacteria bacterium]
MHETPADLEQLQELLDSSYAQAGKNLRDIHAQGRHLTAVELARRLDGPRWLVVATVNSHNRPFTAQVDGTFYRGHFYFGVNDPCSLKARHLIRTPPSVPHTCQTTPGRSQSTVAVNASTLAATGTWICIAY